MKKFVTNKNKRLKGPVRKKEGNETSSWDAPDTAAVPQDDDSIINYMKSQFDKTMPYYTTGISTTHTDRKKAKKPTE